MPRIVVRLALSVALMLTVLAVAGCGSSDEDETRAVVKEFFRSLDKKDAARTCALMTPRAEAQMTAFFGVFGAGGGGCVAVLKKTTPDEDRPKAGDIDKAKVSRRDDLAILTPAGQKDPVGLRKVDGQWRVDNILNPSLDDKPRRIDPRLTRGSDETQVRATVGAMVDAFAAKQYERVCDLFSDGAEAQVLVAGAFAAGFGDSKTKQTKFPSCAQVLRKLVGPGSGEDSLGASLPSADELDGAEVTIRGQRATVEIAGEDPTTLIRSEGHWLVEGDEPASANASTPEQYERCWKAAGAKIATSAGELRFATAAEASATVSGAGRISVKGDDWRIFYAPPAGGDDPGLAKVLADPASVPVVAYVQDAPDHEEIVAKARACR